VQSLALCYDNKWLVLSSWMRGRASSGFKGRTSLYGGKIMELNKKDIETVARSRFNKQHRWKIVGGTIGWAIIAVAVWVLCSGTSSISVAITSAVLLLAIAVVGVVLLDRAEDKAIKAFVKECEENPVMSYIPPQGEAKAEKSS